MTKANRFSFATFVALLFVMALGACSSTSSDDDYVVDTSKSGAYQFEDGTLVTIGPSNKKRLRMLRFEDGQPFSLYFDNTNKNRFNVAEGFNTQEIVATAQFNSVNQETSKKSVTIDWTEGGRTKTLTKLPLIRKRIDFKSGELTLRGELTLPAGKGPFPLVVTVHGSERSSAVDHYPWPYMLAAKGIAGFKFDKRGTGQSQGEYTQNFPALAGDVIAGINRVIQEPEIDSNKVNLIGFSQGGWVAPFVAKQTQIKSYIVGFGTTVPVPREDRWGYVKRLLDNGFGEDEIALADEMNGLISNIVYEHDDTAWDELIDLVDKHQADEWFKTIAGSDSLLGMVSSKLTHQYASWVPNFAWKWYTQFKRGKNKGPGFNRKYEPMETMTAVKTPSLWLLAGEDTSIPTPETVKDLKILQEAGYPVSFRIYEGAEHGNVLYTTDENGDRTYTGYVPQYFRDVVDYFEEQNGL